MKIYVWHSAATSVTGPKIAEALAEQYGENNVIATRRKPDARSGDIVIAYGAKTREPVRFRNGVKVFNHPDSIRVNRNKYEALGKMAADGDVNVPGYDAIDELTDAGIKSIIETTGVAVARSKYHQMGRGLYLCMTVEDVRKAAECGAYYVQVYKPVRDEYRLHVNFDTVSVASRKELVDNPHDAWKAAYREKVINRFEEEPAEAELALLDKALTIIAKDVNLPDFMVRSHKHGWKFKRLNVDRVDDRLKTMAVAAVKAIGLDFGAVDCAIDKDGNPFIIEVNSGAGLDGRSFTKFIEAITEKIAEADGGDRNPEPAPRARAQAADIVEAVNEELAPAANNDRYNDLANVVANLAEQQREMTALLARVIDRI